MAIERKLSPTHDAPYRGLRMLDFGRNLAWEDMRRRDGGKAKFVLGQNRQSDGRQG